MLPKTHRLPAPEISHVMKYGSRIAGNGVTLIYRFIPQGGIPLAKPRFTFIVSTKADKRATVRNRIRRLMSESVRHHFGDIVPGVDGVFIGSRGLAGLDQKEVEKRVVDVLRQSRFLKP